MTTDLLLLLQLLAQCDLLKLAIDQGQQDVIEKTARTLNVLTRSYFPPPKVDSDEWTPEDLNEALSATVIAQRSGFKQVLCGTDAMLALLRQASPRETPHYILDLDHRVIPVGPEFACAVHDVAQTQIGQVWISTVFTAIAQGSRDGKPLVFETLARGITPGGGIPDLDPGLPDALYATWEEAKAGHARWVERFVIKESRSGE